MSLHESLVTIQKTLKAPKDQKNAFGNYNYRSCEDILEALKPLLAEENLFLTLSDEIVEVAGRVYVKALATLGNGQESLSVSAFARESLDKKGMDDAQITGSASSYARKYALNGLFCIDDTKDSDATNDHGRSAKPIPAKAPQTFPPVQRTNGGAVQPVARPAPVKPVPPAAKPKPTTTTVMEFLTAAKTLPTLQKMFDKASSHEWTDDEAKVITECFENSKKRIEEETVNAAERQGMKAA